MDSKERQLFTLMWSLLVKYQALLGDVLPTIHEIRSVLGGGLTPSPEQLRAWQESADAFDRRFHGISVDFESLHQVADPLFGYDA